MITLLSRPSLSISLGAIKINSRKAIGIAQRVLGPELRKEPGYF